MAPAEILLLGAKSSLEKMQKRQTSRSQIPSSLQAMRSSPAELKFIGLPGSHPAENCEVNGNMVACNLPGKDNLSDNDAEGVDVSFSYMDQMNEDSPYTKIMADLEEAHCEDDLDLDFVASLLPVFAPLHAGSRWSDTDSYVAKKKLQAWCQMPNGDWTLGNILSSSGTESIISLHEGKVFKVNADSLLPANPNILDGVDDLMQLSYLNEPSVLYNLQVRYSQDMIYTKAGPVLVAINPFKSVPLYGNECIEDYKRKSIDSPHVYAIADTAIREMIRDEVNQSIIIRLVNSLCSVLKVGKTLFLRFFNIKNSSSLFPTKYTVNCNWPESDNHQWIQGSGPVQQYLDERWDSVRIGESGAGKTETAKIAMQYLAAFGGGSGIEYEILKTNPILEAFGNAKTSRNDNSSRFGKLIEIQFSETGKISGAKIQTCKSRVVQCADGERSYHIFYQLCAGAPPTLREKLNLKSAQEYRYLKQSKCISIAGVDDVKMFQSVMEALDIVHISKKDQENVFAMLAAVLWMGNIKFTMTDNENHAEPVEDEALKNVAKLIGCSVGDLNLALSTRKMRVRNDDIIQKLTLSQASDTRDALAKSLYASLFEWLVEQINKSLEVGKQITGRSISILDIYGFESFGRNSFEQFCINYANERLQQHFNRHLFKLEQEEYNQEGIEWKKVDFEDNQDCLNLFENKPLGLLSLLDEESTFPNGTDLSFANKLKQHLNSNSRFQGERDRAFTVCHYAGEVTYDTSGFLEKNRDLLHADSIELLSSCTCPHPQIFASNMLSQSDKPLGHLYRSSAVDCQKLSVVTKFKDQLFQLMQWLEKTTPHFIRCIKPNDSQLPGVYKQGMVLQQLRCCGVLEVVRISRSGYPTRMSHQKFARRYGFLLLGNIASRDPLSVSVAILHQFNILPEMYQVGYTKLFFRSGQIGILEETRNHTLHGILRVQSCFRGYQARCHLTELRRGIATLQSFIRGEKMRQDYAVLVQRYKAAVVIQKQIKCWISRKTFRNICYASILIQSVIRGWLVRRCSGDISLLGATTKLPVTEGTQNDKVMVKQSVLAELQQRVLKTEEALQEKEEQNDILRQRLQQYECRWSEYELKMKNMEEVWQKQMKSLQSSISIANESFSIDEIEQKSDPLVQMRGNRNYSWDIGHSFNGIGAQENIGVRSVRVTDREKSVGLSVISRLAEEFEQRIHLFGDDAKFLMEVKSGQAESSVDPNQELKRLKHMFEVWKKDYNSRLRETKLILQKLGSSEGNADKVRKKWWLRTNSMRI